MSTLRLLRDRLVRIGPHPPSEDLNDLAGSLARECASKRYPRKSLAAWERHHADVPCAERVVALAAEELGRLESDTRVRAEPPEMRWLTTQAAAAMLGIGIEELRARLRTSEGRYTLGWPWWDGHRWLLPEPALDPRARADYMASLPAEEPPAHRASLPDWCREAV